MQTNKIFQSRYVTDPRGAQANHGQGSGIAISKYTHRGQRLLRGIITCYAHDNKAPALSKICIPQLEHAFASASGSVGATKSVYSYSNNNLWQPILMNSPYHRGLSIKNSLFVQVKMLLLFCLKFYFLQYCIQLGLCKVKIKKNTFYNSTGEGRLNLYMAGMGIPSKICSIDRHLICQSCRALCLI